MKLDYKLFFSTLMLSSVSHTSYAIIGDGLNNPLINHQLQNNIVRISGVNNCSGVIIGGNWLLTTNGCQYSNNEYVNVQTGISELHSNANDHQFDNDYIALTRNTVFHPAQDDLHLDNKNILMKMERVPVVSQFNAINPTMVNAIMTRTFYINTGLYYQSPDEDCFPDYHRRYDIGDALAMFGFGDSGELRTGLVEATRSTFDSTDDSWIIGGYIHGYVSQQDLNENNQDYCYHGIAAERGDAGGPYLDRVGDIVAVHHGMDSYTHGMMTRANPLSHQPEWLLNTINAWHYPTLVNTIDGHAVVAFQSLHHDEIDLLANLSAEGVEINVEGIVCQNPSGDSYSAQDDRLIVNPFDTCYMPIKKVADNNARLYLSPNEVMMVDISHQTHGDSNQKHPCFPFINFDSFNHWLHSIVNKKP